MTPNVAKTCDHAIFYQLTLGHAPMCLACQPPPPRQKPARVGLLLPSGRLETAVDIRAAQLRLNRTGATLGALNAVRAAWPEGDWLLADASDIGECGHDGWPRYSTGGICMTSGGKKLFKNEQSLINPTTTSELKL
jgi:hypothetical protein